MAQFDVCALPDDQWVVIVQADPIALNETAVIVPLMASDQPAVSVRRLHPQFIVANQNRVLATHLVSVVRRRDLSTPFASLVAHEYEIKGALDVLTGGI